MKIILLMFLMFGIFSANVFAEDVPNEYVMVWKVKHNGYVRDRKLYAKNVQVINSQLKGA